MTSSQMVALRVTPDDAYVLLSSMEVASSHDECDATPEQFKSLWDRLHLFLEEHGAQGDTLEEILG